MNAKINIEVNLASHTQYAPQVKFPHIDPVTKTIMLIINPIGDKDLATVNAVGDLNIKPMILLIPITRKIANDNQAVGTCINIILNEIPW